MRGRERERVTLCDGHLEYSFSSSANTLEIPLRRAAARTWREKRAGREKRRLRETEGRKRRNMMDDETD